MANTRDMKWGGKPGGGGQANRGGGRRLSATAAINRAARTGIAPGATGNLVTRQRSTRRTR